ncbi:MAG: phospholipid carrier-dependent glycosyltransferase [Chloroflexota bacterium]
MSDNRFGRWLTGRGTAVLLMWLAFALLLSSAVQKSATVDEQSHLFRGVAYLKSGATHFLLGHPLLASSLSALPLLTEPNLQLPVNEPAWTAGDWSLAEMRFCGDWRITHSGCFCRRLPVIWMTLLLGALVGRWGRQLAGRKAGLLAMALLLLDPNVLAHGRFITGDLPLTLFFLLTVYGYWLWMRERREREEGRERREEREERRREGGESGVAVGWGWLGAGGGDEVKCCAAAAGVGADCVCVGGALAFDTAVAGPTVAGPFGLAGDCGCVSFCFVAWLFARRRILG